MLVKLNKALVSQRTGREDDQKGFTLIELLVVIIIIGILAAIAIPVFLNQRESAWKASVANDLKNAAIVVETYGTNNNGSYASFPNTGYTATTTVANVGTIVVSDDNTITVTATGNAYTIVGSNSNTGGSQTYSSSAGGLQDWAAAPATP